ncbi:hypothetical protein [Caballeronia sp. LZ019]|uniref:hypothetical protein n=1 Tax=Caballeronia sp. LZ019 TaxID=3038555 RepID=UPI00285FD527|nr:hypothetical protein [Caballeronia sp. LZ019]MDR5808207.1 hypothetical protein [Caballeronia sp. LZ019]
MLRARDERHGRSSRCTACSLRYLMRQLQAIRVIVANVDACVAQRGIATASFFYALVFLAHFTMLTLIAMFASLLDVLAMLFALGLFVVLELVRLCKDTRRQASDDSGGKQFLRHGTTFLEDRADRDDLHVRETRASSER